MRCPPILLHHVVLSVVVSPLFLTAACSKSERGGGEKGTGGASQAAAGESSGDPGGGTSIPSNEGGTGAGDAGAPTSGAGGGAASLGGTGPESGGEGHGGASVADGGSSPGLGGASTDGGVSTSVVGGSSSGGATSEDIGGASNGGAGTSAGAGGTVSGEGGAEVGGRSSSFGGGILGLGGGTAGFPATTPEDNLVLIEDGAECSPVAARGCTAEDPQALMVCSAGNVWQWSEDCPSGSLCDPRPGLRVGTCVSSDSECVIADENGCSNQRHMMVECTASDLLLHATSCYSWNRMDCSEGACAPWNPCDAAGNPLFSAYCTDECSSASPLPECALDGVGPMAAWDINDIGGVIVPPAAKMPSVPECPDMHVFMVWDSDPDTVDFRRARAFLPPGYWALVLSPPMGVSNYAEAVTAACEMPQYFDGWVDWSPEDGEVVLIVSNQMHVPSFAFP